MKKIKKAAKSSASAPKPAVKAKSKPTKANVTAARGASRTTKKTAPVKAKTRVKKRRVSAAPTPAPALASATVVVRAPVVTTITAHIDIGFGNALYLRGQGADLSWDRGTLMNCVADNCWSLELPESGRPVIFKFLVNDLSWSAGQDFTVASGDTLATTPTF
jgi:hypothetical protein